MDSTSPYYNPDGEWGFYRAKLMSATKPVSPQFGIVIRHKRCPADIGHQACPTVRPTYESELDRSDSFFVV